MKIGIHSDLHIEHSLCKISNLHELDILILAGDIGDLYTANIFFEQLRDEVPELVILYVLGNHEFYGLYYPDAKEQYRSICQKYNVTLLDNEIYFIGDKAFLGTTLWTNFDLAKKQSESMEWARHHVSDFSKIFSRDTEYSKTLTPELMLSEFHKAYNFLSLELKKLKAKNLQTIIISHFLPAIELVAEKFLMRPNGLMYSAYWGSDLYELFSNVDYWIYGHSHTNIETQAKAYKTQFLCNQRGYSRIFNKPELSDYRHDYVVSI